MQGRNDNDVDDLKRTRHEEQTGGGLPHEYYPSTKKHKRDDHDGGVPATATTMTAADSAMIDRHGRSDTGHSCMPPTMMLIAAGGKDYGTTTALVNGKSMSIIVPSSAAAAHPNENDDDMSTGATMMVMDVDDEKQQQEEPTTTTTVDYCFYLEDRHLPPPVREKGPLPLRGDGDYHKNWAMIRPPRQSPSRQAVRSAQRQVWGVVLRSRSKDEDESANMT
jgi:hypothetical protein